MSAFLRLLHLQTVSSKEDTSKLSVITSKIKEFLTKRGFEQDDYYCYIDDDEKICVSFYDGVLSIFIEPAAGGFKISVHTVVYRHPNFKPEIKEYGVGDFKLIEKVMPLPMPKKTLAELMKKPNLMASVGSPVDEMKKRINQIMLHYRGSYQFVTKKADPNYLDTFIPKKHLHFMVTYVPGADLYNVTLHKVSTTKVIPDVKKEKLDWTALKQLLEQTLGI